MPHTPEDRSEILSRSQHAASLDLLELSVGQTFSEEHCFDSASVDAFAMLTGDFSPLHVDENYSHIAGFGHRVVHGLLLASLFSRLVGMRIPGRQALYLGQDLSFRRPVLVGETVVATAKIVAINTSLRQIHLATTILKSDHSIAVSGTGRVLVRGTSSQKQSDVETRPAPRSDGRRVALVTGASRGIGAAIARRLADDGFAVAVNYKSNEEAARQVVDGIVSSGGVAVPLRADIREEASVESMISGVVERLGAIDLLVNNAAPGYETRSAMETAWSNIVEQMNVSVRAPLILSRAAFPYLRDRQGGIINIISQVIDNQPPPQMLDYVVGKFGLLGLTRALASEWAAEGVRVNGIAPGLIQTDMTSHVKDRIFKLEAAKTPLKRLATPEDVAAAASYLAGKDASFVTGIVVPVTGGQVMM